MYLKQADVFWGTSRDFSKNINEITTKKHYSAGDLIFREGQAANTFYILLKGRVKLTVSATSNVVYTVNHAGEAFGWSSLIDRDTYSATAECVTDTNLLLIERVALEPILEKHPLDGQIFFKKLAGTLGNRLLQSYKTMALEAEPAQSTSFGTGQVMAATVQE